MNDIQGGMNIAQAILAVYSKVGYVMKTGTMKGGAQNYKYASESDLIESLRPSMIEAGLISYPVAIRGECINIPIKDKYGNDAVKNHAKYIYTFRVIHAPSGEYIDIEASGEGVGNDDKSSYKAATGALKYALRQLFLIETGDDPDKDPVAQREEEERKRKEEESIAAKAKSEEERLKNEAKFYIVIPMLEDETDGNWIEYTDLLMNGIKSLKSKGDFISFRNANNENMAILEKADPELRGQVSQYASKKMKDEGWNKKAIIPQDHNEEEVSMIFDREKKKNISKLINDTRM